MPNPKGGKRIKNDSRDARQIAECLANGTYSAVHPPDEEALAVVNYLRCREDHVQMRKATKQQIQALCLRHGKYYRKTPFTKVHLGWFRGLELPNLVRETLDEYIATYDRLEERIASLDARVIELAYPLR